MKDYPKSAILIFFFGAYCAPTEFIYKENVYHNFSEEGFLAADMVQTIGIAGVTRHEAGLEAARTRCLEDAYLVARDRAVSIMLHTNLEIPPSSKYGSGDFESDYPFRFNQKELLLGAIDFEPILKEGFIAMQDSRSPTECTVVFRIRREKLADTIRFVTLTFCVDRPHYRTLPGFLKGPGLCEE
jgi:hypothetical protein